MTTIKVDSEDFRLFIDWLIKNWHIDNSWETIKIVFADPDYWLEEYHQFQKETYEPEIRSYKCKECGATVTEKDVKDYETAEEFGLCGKCYHDPDKWGNE